jgi:hypothetical protein
MRSRAGEIAEQLVGSAEDLYAVRGAGTGLQRRKDPEA